MPLRKYEERLAIARVTSASVPSAKKLPTFLKTIALQQCKLIGHPRVETVIGSHEVA